MKPTKDQLDRYHQELEAFESDMLSKKPKREEFKYNFLYEKALLEWERAWICDRPNRPGYEFANND